MSSSLPTAAITAPLNKGISNFSSSLLNAIIRVLTLVIGHSIFNCLGLISQR
jgi:hypothetical protein